MKSKPDVPIFAGLFTLLIAALVLSGWALDIPTLKSVLPDVITMKANTAMMFAVLSVAVLSVRRTSRFSAVFTIAISVFVVSLCFATLLEYLNGVDFGIDQLLIKDPGARGRFPAGRLAPITAIDGIALAISLILIKLKPRRSEFVPLLLTSLVMLTSFQALVGYLIGLTYLFGSAFYTQMAIHTAVCFVVLAVGTFALQKESEFLRFFRAKSSTARMVRGLFFTAVIVPTLVRWLARAGYNHQLYDQDFAQLIQVVGSSAIMAIITIFMGRALVEGERNRRAQQTAIEGSEQRLRHLADSMTQLAWIAEPNGDITWFNKRWYDFTGTRLETMHGRGWESRLHPSEQARVRTAVLAAWAQGESWEQTFRLRSIAGDYKWFLTRTEPFRDENGRITQWFGTNTDINDQKLAAEKLEQARDEAERASQLKSAFLANMSHEIRTPLAAVLGFADLLRDVDLNAIERSNFLDIITRNGDHLAVIINDILDLSKVEAGHLQLEFSRTKISDVVGDVMDLLGIRAKEKKLVFEYREEPSTPSEIVTDPVRLKQILVNIIGNALKFTRTGSVRITSRGWREQDGATLGIAFEVSDTGIGIRENHREHLFDIFVQADGSMTRRFGGTGLGLALSRRLARQLGGDVFVQQTQEGLGTTFIVQIDNQLEALITKQIPIKDERAASVTLSAGHGTSLTGLKVLIVDDAPDNRELISRYLTKKGAHVLLAENGLQGYEMAVAGDFDIILMDIQMPVMDGYMATQKLRDSGFRKPIIAITAHAMTEVLRRCLAVGCNDHLSKPIDFKALTETIAQYTVH